MMKRKLTAQQEKFVDNLLEGMSQDEAYIQAGYRARGAAARVNASRLLTNANIKTILEKRRKKVAYEAEISAERILKEEMCLAFFDPGDLVDKNGKLLSLHKLPENVRRVIVGLEVITQPKGKLKFKYKFSDKGRALDRLERIEGMFAPEKHEIAGKEGNAIDLTTIVLRVTEKNESGTSN